jgi:LPS-assembly protein
MRRTIGCAALAAWLLYPTPTAAQSGNPFESCRADDVIRFQGSRSEAIEGRPTARRITLTGPVEISCNDLRLFADQVVFDDDTNDVVASGNVTLEQAEAGLRVFAERAELNGRTKLGTFFNASGTARIGGATTSRSMFGTQEPDVMFRGREIARTAPTTYRITDGGFTTCVQPTPRWEMSGVNGTIHLDRYALLRHVVLRVKDVPIFYLPAIYYPINKEDRATGFLLPTYGTSTFRGGSVSNAFFWAISRSQDATFFHDWFVKTGQGLGSEYRYVASPGSQGRALLYLESERAQTTSAGTDGLTDRSFRLDGDLGHQLPAGFRLFATANYFTNIASLQSAQNLDAYSRRQRSFRATLNGNLGRLRLAATVDRNDYFYGTEQGQRSGRAPSVNLAFSESPVGRTRIYYGGTFDASYLVRQDNLADPSTDRSLWRFDGGPSVRAPLSSLPFLTATGTASWRLTRWLETYDPLTGQVVPVAMNRQLFDLRAQVVGPVLARVFQRPDGRYATGFKHLIEPAFTIQRTTPYLDEAQSRRIIQNDYAVDGLVGGVTTVRYGVTNRLLAKRPLPGAAAGSATAQGIAREILSVEVGQSYYTDARALRNDSQYQSGGSTGAGGTFSPIQITAIGRPTDSASAQFRGEIDSRYKQFRSITASGGVQTERVQFTTGWSKRFVIERLPGFGTGSDYLDASATLRTRGNRWGGTYAFNFDVANTSFLQQRVVAYLNSQCCGVSVDWQSISLPLLGIPADRRFGVSFTLAGIGSFSNPLGSFGGR